MTKLVFSTHIYEWEGQLFLQIVGGPTGLRSVGPISRSLMDEWIEMVLEISEKSRILHTLNPVMFSKMDIQMIEKYVDDCFTCLTKLSPGTRWCKVSKILIWSREASEADKGKSMEQITME